MEKIILNADLYQKLDHLCGEMNIGKEEKPNEKVANHLRRLYDVSGYLANEYEAFADRTDDVLDALYDKDFVTGIDGLSHLVGKIAELQSELHELTKALKGTLISLRDLTAPSAFRPLYAEDEVRAVLDERLRKIDFMSLGYQNGKYALLFDVDENDQTQLAPPFVFAEGSEEDVEEARAYIETFLDMEEV